MAVITSYWTLDVLLLLLSAVMAAYFYMTRNFNYWIKRGVTEASSVPFFGSLRDFCLLRTTIGMHFGSLYEQGAGLPYLGFYVFDKPALLLRDPEIIKAVTMRDFNYFQDRYVSAHELDTVGAGNMFVAKNPGWKRLRQSGTSIFTSGKMKGMFPLMSAVGTELVHHLNAIDLRGDGQDIDVKDVCGKFITDLIFSYAFGLQVNSLNEPESAFKKCGATTFGSTSFVRCAQFAASFFAPAAVKLLNLRFLSKETDDFMRKVFKETTAMRLESGVKRNDLIDILIQIKDSQKDEPDGIRFDDDNLVGQAATFFAAGFESSSSSMSFTLYELALHPNIQSRLRKEIISALEESQGEVTYDMVMNLPYLDMVMSETLRKYPFLSFLDRVATRDYRVPGTDLVIEQGTPVYVSLFGLHYDPEYFPDPEKYDPERFSTENNQKRPFCTYTPFGEGPRNCIGLRFGQLQSKLGIMKIILNYEVTPCSRTITPIRFEPKAILLASRDGIFLNVRRITTATSD